MAFRTTCRAGCRVLAMVAGTLAAAECGGSTKQYVLEPTVRPEAVVSGRTASDYPVPPDAPKGDVRIAALGVRDLRPDPSGSPMRVLVVRVVVSNAADATSWTLDTRNQFAAIPGEGRSRAAYVNTDAGVPPLVVIAPGAERRTDFFFPLPRGMEKLADVPGFQFVWQLGTSVGVISQQTPFERFEVQPPPDYSFDIGYGPTWYYDPLWPDATFLHPVYLGPAFEPRPFIGGGPRPGHVAPPPHR